MSTSTYRYSRSDKLTKVIICYVSRRTNFSFFQGRYLYQ